MVEKNDSLAMADQKMMGSEAGSCLLDAALAPAG